MTGHRGAVVALAISSDGRLLSGSADTTALLWTVEGAIAATDGPQAVAPRIGAPE